MTGSGNRILNAGGRRQTDGSGEDIVKDDISGQSAEPGVVRLPVGGDITGHFAIITLLFCR